MQILGLLFTFYFQLIRVHFPLLFQVDMDRNQGEIKYWRPTCFWDVVILTRFLITENIISSLTSRSLFTGVSSNGTVMKPDISVHNTSYIVSNHFFFIYWQLRTQILKRERDRAYYFTFLCILHSVTFKL